MKTKRNMPDADEFRRIIDSLTVYDPLYINLFFDDDAKVPLAQKILRIITGRSGLIIREVRVENEIASLLGRGIRLDVCAVGAEGDIFDAEFQRAKSGAKPQRARLNAGVIDANISMKGTDTSSLDLPTVYVIFITEEDVLGEGRPVYHIERIVTESGKPFGDGSYIIYVNGSHEDKSTELGKLIHDLRCRRADDMLIPELAERTRELKDTEKGVMKMSSLFEDFIETRVQQSRIEGRMEGERNTALSAARSLLGNGVPADIIARSIPALSLSEIMAMDAARGV